MEFPAEYKYTKDHEWVLVEGGMAIVGITEFAQAELGDLVFVDLPAVGKSVKTHATLCVVESTKAASDVYSPVAGTVAERNDMLTNDPGLINKAPYTAGWIVKLAGVSEAEVAGLMSADEYQQLVSK